MEAYLTIEAALNLALATIAVEAAVLSAYRVLTGRGIALLRLLPNLAAGAALLLGARAAASSASWMVIGGCLTAGLAAHVLDLLVRWRHG